MWLLLWKVRIVNQQDDEVWHRASADTEERTDWFRALREAELQFGEKGKK